MVIEGVTLTPSQSMTLRVAISNFMSDMADPLALGDDEHGRFMTKAYRDRCREIEHLLLVNRM